MGAALEPSVQALSTTIAPTSQISNVLSSLLTFQAVQIPPSTSNITLPPR